jgi:hypothetical protein
MPSGFAYIFFRTVKRSDRNGGLDISGQPGQSLGVQLTGEKAGLWHDRATGEGGNFHKLVASARGYSEEDAVSDIERAVGVLFHGSNGVSNHQNKPDLRPTWEAARTRAKESIEELAEFRGFGREHCEFLIDCGLIGLHTSGKWCTPVYDSLGSLISLHVRTTSENWFYEPKGIPVQPLIYGDLLKARTVHVLESQWDMFALIAMTRWHFDKTVAFFCTRGVGMVSWFKDGCQIAPPSLSIRKTTALQREKNG